MLCAPSRRLLGPNRIPRTSSLERGCESVVEPFPRSDAYLGNVDATKAHGGGADAGYRQI